MYLYTNDDKGGNDDNQPNWVKKIDNGDWLDFST